jgi:hypothetical protein
MKTLREILYEHNCDDESAIAWSDGYGTAFAQAWDECPFGPGMVAFCMRIGVDKKRVIRAAAACVEGVIDLVPAGEPAPAESLEAAKLYTTSTAFRAGEDAWAAGIRCREYAYRIASRYNTPETRVADAASVVALACGAPVPFQRARFAKQAVTFAVEAMMIAHPKQDKDRQRSGLYRQCAERVRACIPLLLVAEALGMEVQP